MPRLYKHPDDFESAIRIFSTDLGRRMTLPFNGIRWDLPVPALIHLRRLT